MKMSQQNTHCRVKAFTIRVEDRRPGRGVTVHSIVAGRPHIDFYKLVGSVRSEAGEVTHVRYERAVA